MRYHGARAPGTADVAYDAGRVTVAELIAALARAGWTARPA